MRKLFTTIAAAGLFSVAGFTAAYAALADHVAERDAVLSACSLEGTPEDCALARAAYEAVLAADPDITPEALLAELNVVADEVLDAVADAVGVACSAAGDAEACSAALADLSAIAAAAGVPQEDLVTAVNTIEAEAPEEFASLFEALQPGPGATDPTPSPTA